MWNEREKKPIAEFIFWTFFISWVIEGSIILIEQFGILPLNMQKPIIMILIGFGAGLAPAYATFIILYRNHKIKNLKDFMKKILTCQNSKVTIIALVIIMGYQLLKCILTEQLLGLPLICFLLFIPLLIFGGGLEEIGWRGFLQPALEEKMPFVLAIFTQGIIWSVWHIPLWFIQNANQSKYNFISFMLYCIAFSFSLALLYRISKCVWAVIILHA